MEYLQPPNSLNNFACWFIQGVPKRSDNVEIILLLQFECLSAKLSPRVHKYLQLLVF